jgi:peptide/nickel transport system substrate-binding protein
VFERFAGYVPRPEPASWLAGGKKMLIDRIEWIVMPDPGASAAALQNGEIDWWEQPLPDLAPLLRRNRNVTIDIADPLGNVGSFRMNHLHPPFNDVRARRAILMAMSQEDYMRAVIGNDTSLWKPMPSFIPPGTPIYNEEGGEILKGARNLDAAKRLLAQSGYAGQPVVCMAAQDQPSTRRWARSPSISSAGSASTSISSRPTGAPWWGGARRNRRPARAAGTCSTRCTPG